MARIRTIKPEFFTNEDIVDLTPLARLFYVALWCEADREGRLSWKPKTLKMRYLPADDCEIENLAQELIDMELVVVYQVDGKDYAEIPGFNRHQVINNRESQSTIPSRVKDACTRVQGEGRKEGKGKEGASKKTRIPSDFQISERVKKWAQEKGYSNLQQHHDHFVLTAKARDYKYADWDSAFMNAIRNDWARVGSAPDQDDLKGAI